MQAVEFMRRGLEQYKKRDFEGARANFASAWALERHPAVAANLADVETRLGRYREAAEHWSFYLANAPPDRDRSDGEIGLAECRKHVARVDVAAEEKVTISIDGHPVGQTPLPGELWLDPGVHVIEARFTDGGVASERVELLAGDAKHVALVPVASQSATKAASVPSPGPAIPAQTNSADAEPRDSHESKTSLRTPVLVGGATFTAVALALGAVYALKARNASNDAEELSKKIHDQVGAQGQGELVTNASACKYGGAPVSSDCHALATNVESAKKARSTAQVAFIAGGILGAGTLAAYLLWPRSEASSASLIVLPWQSQGASGVIAQGSF